MGRGTFVLLALLALGACPRRAPAPVEVQAATAPRVLADLGQRLAAAAGGPAGLAAGGTAKGEVLLLAAGQVRRLEAIHDAAVTLLAFSSDGTGLVSVGGRAAAYWSTQRRELVRQVRGPQTITAAALAPDGNSVFFGTDQGHVLRWPLGESAGQAVRNFACGATPVYPSRLQLPPSKRCPFGTHLEAEQGLKVCVYPVTHLVVGGHVLARACRAGTLGLMDLGRLGVTFGSVGHLRTLIPVEPGLWLLGREEGQLRLYDPRSREVLRSFLPEGRPDAAASHGALMAVAQGRSVRFWHRDHADPVGAIPGLPGQALWMRLGARELEVMLDDGQRLSYALEVRAAR